MRLEAGALRCVLGKVLRRKRADETNSTFRELHWHTTAEARYNIMFRTE